MSRALLFLVLTGCTKSVAPLQVVDLYQHDSPNIESILGTTVLIPGIMGSQLTDPSTGRVYWGEAMGDTPKPAKRPEDARMFALPMEANRPLHELTDTLVADRILGSMTLKVVGGTVYARAYPGIFTGIADMLETHREGRPIASSEQMMHGDLPYTAMPYDWRQDLTSQLAALDAKVKQAVDARKRMTGMSRVDIIAHSMGTQLTRYYLRYGTTPPAKDGTLPPLTWAGAQHIEHAILVAPPNLGSPILFENLVHGKHVAVGLPFYPPAIVATFPSVFSLLPRVAHGRVRWSDTQQPVDFHNLELWRQYQWGALHPDQDPLLQWLLPETTRQERVAIVEDQLVKCLQAAERFQAALDVPHAHPEHLKIHLFAGDRLQTPSVFEVDRTTGEVTLAETAPGDGQVTRRSALHDLSQGPAQRLQSPEKWDSVHFGSVNHTALTGDSELIDAALYLLLEHPRNISSVQAPSDVGP